MHTSKLGKDFVGVTFSVFFSVSASQSDSNISCEWTFHEQEDEEENKKGRIPFIFLRTNSVVEKRKRNYVEKNIVKNVKRFITIPRKKGILRTQPMTTMMMMMGWIVNWPNRHIKWINLSLLVFFFFLSFNWRKRAKYEKKNSWVFIENVDALQPYITSHYSSLVYNMWMRW